MIHPRLANSFDKLLGSLILMLFVHNKQDTTIYIHRLNEMNRSASRNKPPHQSPTQNTYSTNKND